MGGTRYERERRKYEQGLVVSYYDGESICGSNIVRTSNDLSDHEIRAHA